MLAINFFRALLVAQLVEQLLPIPEICSSNPIIGKVYFLSTVINLYSKDENTEKRPGMAH